MGIVSFSPPDNAFYQIQINFGPNETEYVGPNMLIFIMILCDPLWSNNIILEGIISFFCL